MRAFFILCWYFSGIALMSGYAHSAPQTPATNVEQLQKIIRTTVEAVIQAGEFHPGQRIRIITVKDENSWILDQSIYNGFIEHGLKILTAETGDSASADGRCEFFPVSLGVKYAPAFHDGLFSEARTARTVEGKFSTSVIWKDGTVQMAKIYYESVTDTIAVSDLSSVEHPSYRAARGEPPATGFFDALLEPLVILGTLAIAVYLLFTVRS